MSNILEDIKKRLTQNYKSTNIYKLMQIVSEELDDIKIVYKRIEDWQDLQQAEGVALDKIGQDLLQFRGEVNDEVYRVLIASRIARNKATGTYNNMIEVLSLALNVEPSEIVIEEGIAGEPQTITLIQIPLTTLAEIGMTINQLGRIVAKLTAAGIGVKYVEFFGTFEYIGDTLGFDLDTGYADENMVNGGTLGDLYQPENDPDFPL
ncbi:MAG: hypothetical protein LC100_06210 [Chitinophagales bacterium]|nr:hypothetical protein [Chitinophagales bacterium]